MSVPVLQAQTQAHLAKAVKTLKRKNSAAKSFLARCCPGNLFFFSVLWSYLIVTHLSELDSKNRAWLFSPSLVGVSWEMESTWNCFRLCRRPERHGCWLGPALLILCHHIDIVLGVPLQPAEHHVLTATGQPDLWFPVCSLYLRTHG